jgi:hypothetical protein
MPRLASQPIKTRTIAPLWYAGVCDDLYQKIAIWQHVYWHGMIHSTRQFVEKIGRSEDNIGLRIVDKPVKIAHQIPFREIELDNLIRILQALRPNTPMVDEWKTIRSLWKNGKPVVGRTYNRSYWAKVLLPQGLHRVLTVVFYDEHVKELLDILSEAKTGQKAATLDIITAERQAEGKDIFEE